jgi:hypothetical protein
MHRVCYAAPSHLVRIIIIISIIIIIIIIITIIIDSLTWVLPPLRR